LQRVPRFGTNRCCVVAGKLIAVYAPIHLACLLREFFFSSNRKVDRAVPCSMLKSDGKAEFT
jgi:hypothetical protein